MAASAVASTSESDAFRKEFNKYNDIHKELKHTRLQDYIVSDTDLIARINDATALQSTDITTAVAKIKAFEQLKLQLPVLTSKYNKIRDDITVNNTDLKALKVLIQQAITAKTVAAAAANADKDAARAALQTQIDALMGVIDTRNDTFEEALTLKNKQVLLMVETDIPKKVDGIKNLLPQGEHIYISKATRDMVEGIDMDITVFKSTVKFESITEPFKGQHETEIAAIKDQIGKLTHAKSGSDINDMNSAVAALASNQPPLSTTLRDFNDAADAFIGTLDTKLGELDGAEARVKDAIAKDLEIFQKEEEKIKELQAKINAVVDSPEIAEINKKIKDVESKYVIVNNSLADDASQLTKQLRNTGYATSITELNTELMKLDNAIHKLLSLPNESFDTIKQQLNDIQSARTSRGINAPSSISILNQKIQGFQDKRKDFNDNYNEHHANHERISAALRQSRSPSPLVPAPPPGARLSSARPPTPTHAAAAAAASSPSVSSSSDSAKSISPMQSPRLKGPEGPKVAWKSRLPSLPPSELELAEMEKIKTSASPESSALVGPMKHFVFIPRNQKGTPPVAYLVEIPADAGGMSPKSLDGSSDGGSKRKHLQRGGAPPPPSLPSNSEIRVIDTQTPGMFEFYTGLTRPEDLLHDSSEENPIHPIIENIRNRIPIVNPAEKTRIYEQIRPYLITKDSSNPLVIGRKAVYKVNILKLLRLLDTKLGTGTQYTVIYEKLSTFMEYDGTFNILKSLFDATFNGKIKLRSEGHLPSITDVFDDLTIMKIVGWKTTDKNVLFDDLFKMFLKQCTSGKNSEFLSNINNLGSKPNLYYRFRLNWIILLAFHSLYLGTSTLENVCWLIDKMHEAFLGWMSREQAIFKQMFTPADYNHKNSQKNYSDKVNGIINRDIQGQPLLFSTLKTIKDKLCDLEENMDLDVEADVDEDDDPDYEPSDDGGSDDGSYSGSSITSSRSSLSSAGLSYKDVVQGGPALRKPLRPETPRDIEISKKPPSPQLNLKTIQPVLWPSGVEQQPVTADFLEASKMVAKNRRRPPPIQSPDMPGGNNPWRDLFGDEAGTGGVVDTTPRSGEPTSQQLSHSARSISGTGRNAWSGPSPSTKNRHTTTLNSRPSEKPSPPSREKPSTSQNDTKLFSRRQQIQPVVPELDFGEVSEFDSAKSTQLLNRLQQDARRPNTARPRQSQQIQPFSSGSLSARTQSARISPERYSSNDSVKGRSASGWFTGRRDKQVHPEPSQINGAVNPDWLQENKAGRVLPSTYTIKRNQVAPEGPKGPGKGGSHKKRTRKHKKHTSISASRRPTRRRRIPPTEGHKYTRKRPRT